MAPRVQSCLSEKFPSKLCDAIAFELDVVKTPDDAFIAALADALYADWCEHPAADDNPAMRMLAAA
jgi:hypothetical protein